MTKKQQIQLGYAHHHFFGWSEREQKSENKNRSTRVMSSESAQNTKENEENVKEFEEMMKKLTETHQGYNQSNNVFRTREAAQGKWKVRENGREYKQHWGKRVWWGGIGADDDLKHGGVIARKKNCGGIQRNDKTEKLLRENVTKQTKLIETNVEKESTGANITYFQKRESTWRS